MLCTKCGKRPASVHVEQRLNGQKMEEYLCEECAEALWGFGTLNLNKVFSSHFGLGAPGPVQTCPGCGLSLAEFNGTGRLPVVSNLCATAFAGCQQVSRQQAAYWQGEAEQSAGPADAGPGAGQ